MSAFEFFFSFYGLLLGLSVAALVSGFAQVLHERQRVRFGWLTPLLAVFVAMDVATFWTQAWAIFRGAPYNPALLVLGLIVAGTFYVAASITFPRLTAEGAHERIDLDDHFWAHRRLVLGCILIANLIVTVLFAWLMSTNAGFAAQSTLQLWVGLGVFVLSMTAAAFAPWRPVAAGGLVLVTAYTLWRVLQAGTALVAQGGWSPVTGG